MTRRGILIEDRRRLSLAFRWRDRCLTVALVGVWWHPFDALRHLIASEAFRWNVFVADLADVLTVTAAAVALTLVWGTYDRWGSGRPASPGGSGPLLGTPRIDPSTSSMPTAGAGTPRLTGLARRSSTPGREASARSCGSWRARAGAEPEPPADDPCG